LIHDGLKFCFPVECIDPQFFFPFKNHALRRFVNIPSDQTISTFDVAVKIGQEPFIEKLCLQVTFVFSLQAFQKERQSCNFHGLAVNVNAVDAVYSITLSKWH